VDIERVLRNDNSTDAYKRHRQLEATAHMVVQQGIDLLSPNPVAIIGLV
jgi:hypothetical protein